MKEIVVDATPGVIALFLLDPSHITGSVEGSNEGSPGYNSFLSIAALYGFNHRNINIDAIQNNTTYEYSLKDIYKMKSFPDEYNTRMLSSIEDNIVTPLIVVPFSVEKKTNSETENSAEKMIDILQNTVISTVVANPPKIVTDEPPSVVIDQTPVMPLRRSRKGKSVGGSTSTNSVSQGTF